MKNLNVKNNKTAPTAFLGLWSSNKFKKTNVLKQNEICFSKF